MQKIITAGGESSAVATTDPQWPTLETFAREPVQQFIQRLLVERLERDGERMITYDAFPAEHWRHLRTTNVIESPFHAVRLRTSAAERLKKVDNATALMWKLLLVAEQQFRKLNAPHLCKDVHAGIRYRDRVRVVTPPTRERRAA